MTSIPILAQFKPFGQLATRRWRTLWSFRGPQKRPPLHLLAQNPDRWPPFVQASPVAKRYLRLLGPLDWERFPEHNLAINWGAPAVPDASFIAACLVKLDQQLVYMSQLRQYLVEHPALVWILGFPLVPASAYPWGFYLNASLPTARHFTRMLRSTPNAVSQYLLDETVRLIQVELRTEAIYKQIYKQRTATERINAQAKELGIERPKLRNGHAIANQNTLIYVLINLRALHRLRRKKAERQQRTQ